VSHDPVFLKNLKCSCPGSLWKHARPLEVRSFNCFWAIGI